MKSGRIRSYTRSSREGSCSVGECGRKILAKGYCSGHYSQVSVHGEIKTKIIRRYKESVLDENGNKFCGKCEMYIPVKNFPRGSKTFDGLSNYCKTCTVVGHHGINRKMFDDILIAQSGLCSICDSQLKNLTIDHDHNCCSGVYSCGYCIRGILCRDCNSALGLAKDSEDVLRRMISYLSGGKK